MKITKEQLLRLIKEEITEAQSASKTPMESLQSIKTVVALISQEVEADEQILNKVFPLLQELLDHVMELQKGFLK